MENATGTKRPLSRVSIVVPNFQAGDRLRAFVPRLEAALSGWFDHYEIIVVDDASTDGSVDGVSGEFIEVVRQPRNLGKGAALRRGFELATGDLVGFVDGDGQYDPAVLGPMGVLCEQGWDLAVGQRFDDSSVVSYSASRTLRSEAILALVRAAIDPSLSETQAGIKLMRREVLDAVGPYLRCDGFAIDVELMAFAKRLGFRRHAVHPVAFDHEGASTVTIRRGLRAVAALADIRRRLDAVPAVRGAADPLGTGVRSRRRVERHAAELAAHAYRLAALDAPVDRASRELAARARRPADLDAARRFVRGGRRSADSWSDDPADVLLRAAVAAWADHQAGERLGKPPWWRWINVRVSRSAV